MNLKWFSRLDPAIAQELRAWKHDSQLDKILGKLERARKEEQFFNHYAEAVFARHLLRMRFQNIEVEVPTPNGKQADFRMTINGEPVCFHLKSLNSGEVEQKQEAATNRLQELKNIRRPFLVTLHFYCEEIPNDAELQKLIKQVRKFIYSAQPSNFYSIKDLAGQRIAECRIEKTLNTEQCVHLILMFPSFVLGKEARRYRKNLLSAAYKQFMPNEINIIVVRGPCAGDRHEFETALSNSNHTSGSKEFWHGNDHPESQCAVWFHYENPAKVVFHAIYRTTTDNELRKLVDQIFPKSECP